MRTSKILIYGVLIFIFGAIICFLLLREKDNIALDPYISTLIVPHHDLVAEQRENTFNKVAPRTQNRPIILLAPNHYDNGSATIQTRSSDFSTRFGDIKINHPLQNIAYQNGVVNDDTTYEIEHGVKSLLPDIAKYYPSSEILPLVISEKASISDVESLLTKLKANCTDCLLIVSADFSHYQPYQLSEQHDILTIRGLSLLDSDLLDVKAELEPMHLPSLAIFWANLNKTKRFVLDQHTNSTALDKNYYAEGTTHIMGWYESGEIAEVSTELSFTVTGQMIFDPKSDSNYSSKFDQLGNRVLWGSDLVIGALPNSESLNKRNIDSMLSKLHFSHAATDINIDNGSVSSLQLETKFSRDGQDITLISGTPTQINEYDMMRHKDSNVLVYVDRSEASDMSMTEFSRKWIDNGADVIIGYGIPEVGKTEVYNQRPIIYSIGSFINDSSISESIVIAGRFTEDTIELVPLLINQVDGKPILGRSIDSDSRLLSVFEQLKDYLEDDRGGLLYSINK